LGAIGRANFFAQKSWSGFDAAAQNVSIALSMPTLCRSTARARIFLVGRLVGAGKPTPVSAALAIT